MKTPTFWSQKGFWPLVLWPASWLYQLLGLVRNALTTSYQANIPVICVGNLTSGGTGKTPVTAYLANMAKDAGLRPVILSRGYGGNLSGPIIVDSTYHQAKDCGDEPLLLAQSAPVVISRNRAAGAAFIESQRMFDIIIMDDGMQNPQLAKDHIIVVIDGAIGLQNEAIFPSGPLRTSLKNGLKHADLFMINGTDETGLSARLPQQKTISFDLAPEQAIPETSKTKPLVAFAGIGRPSRFFKTLEKAGYYLAQTKEFGDHHPYSQHDITGLVESARALSAGLITTQKDWVRLPKTCQRDIAYLPVTMHISNKARTHLARMLQPKGQ